jgi:hypothetical protein
MKHINNLYLECSEMLVTLRQRKLIRSNLI